MCQYALTNQYDGMYEGLEHCSLAYIVAIVVDKKEHETTLSTLSLPLHILGRFPDASKKQQKLF